MALPRPDRPQAPKPKKPKRPKTTPRNVYTSPKPKRPNPKIVGRYKNKPKAPSGFVAKQRGGGLGWVLVRAPGATDPNVTHIVDKAAPETGPYAEYAKYPWAQAQLSAIDRDQAAHQQYVTDKVQPWMAAALNNLTGVNPAQPGINATLQQQYLSNVQGVVGGALNAAATATPMMPGPTTGGALVASPTAYLTGAAQQAAQGLSSSYLQQAQTQAALNTMQPNTMAQGAVYRMADYAKGLPQLYADRRSEARTKIDQFIMQFEEEKRQARVQESLGAMNAQANIAISLANLGLDAADVQRRLDESAAELAMAGQTQAPPDPSTIPVGFVAVPDGEGGWNIQRDPTYARPGSPGSGSTAPSAARGQYAPNSLRKEGYVGGWKVKPKNIKGPFVKATDGTWWRKPAKGSASAAGTPKGFGSLTDDLSKKWNGTASGPFGSGTPGWGERFRGNQESIARALADWIVENKASFNTGPGGKVDLDKIRRVLGTLGDGARKYDIVVSYLARTGRLRRSKIV